MTMKFQLLFFFALALFHANGLAIENSDATLDRAEEMESVTALEQNDTPEDEKKYIQDGYCHWEADVWHKPAAIVKCKCLKCTCAVEGKWNCEYSFKDCPYFYCGNVQYNPHTKICCCGKLYDKQGGHNCCGSFYYSSVTSQCCNYYTVRPRNSVCPRYKI